MSDSGHVALTTTLYGELRKLAAARLATQEGPLTLQATALVHEAWLRLGGDHQNEWANRAHFFASVAEVMRNILIERARRRQRIRHGGKYRRVDFSLAERERAGHLTQARDLEFIALHEALEQLTLFDPDTARLVNLRYFAGLTVKELAETLELSIRTTERRLAFARSWLGCEIQRLLAA
jgi:RNA polymerase sigma factor (TIGR02999 family)